MNIVVIQRYRPPAIIPYSVPQEPVCIKEGATSVMWPFPMRHNMHAWDTLYLRCLSILVLRTHMFIVQGRSSQSKGSHLVGGAFWILTVVQIRRPKWKWRPLSGVFSHAEVHARHSWWLSIVPWPRFFPRQCRRGPGECWPCTNCWVSHIFNFRAPWKIFSFHTEKYNSPSHATREGGVHQWRLSQTVAASAYNVVTCRNNKKVRPFRSSGGRCTLVEHRFLLRVVTFR